MKIVYHLHPLFIIDRFRKSLKKILSGNSSNNDASAIFPFYIHGASDGPAFVLHVYVYSLFITVTLVNYFIRRIDVVKSGIKMFTLYTY